MITNRDWYKCHEVSTLSIPSYQNIEAPKRSNSGNMAKNKKYQMFIYFLGRVYGT